MGERGQILISFIPYLSAIEITDRKKKNECMNNGVLSELLSVN